MERRYETIINQDGIEIVVTYHVGEDFNGTLIIDMNHVEIILGGGSIDILPLLDDKQCHVIMDALPVY